MTAKQRYFIELVYDGSRYHGWQVQQNAISVQEVLNKSLSTVLRQNVETTGCGRTDTGVHARKFFAHFDMETEHSPLTMDHSLPVIDHEPSTIDYSPLPIVHRKPTIDHEPSTMDHRTWTMDYKTNLLRSINSVLPKDIAVKNIFPVAASANARFDAILRTYEYHIHFTKDPFKNGYSWELRDRPDLKLMNQAAAILMDYTDFSCFSKSNTQVKTNICRISDAEWLPTDEGIVFRISADRFLRNMVRAIVGTLLMVGKKEIEPDAVHQIIQSKNRSTAGVSVPACGLYLTDVRY